MSRPSSVRSSRTDLGFTLPHEHTQIALWHIQARWDYWQLTRDEPVILDELARFRGGRRQRPRRPDPAGVGRDPAWLRGLARPAACTSSWAAAGIGRPTTRPRRGSTGGPSTTSPTSWSREIDGRGGGHAASGPGSSARSAPTSRGSRRPRSASTGRPPARRDGPGWRSRPTPCMSDVGSPSSGSSRRRAPTRRGSSSATRTRTRSSTTTSRSSGAARASSSTSSGCASARASGTARAAIVELLCDLLARGHADRILLSQDVCHDSQLKRYEGNGYVYLAETFLPRLRAAGVATRRSTDPRSSR